MNYMTSLGFSCCETFSNLFPVHDIEASLEVGRSSVLVIKIVSMLPGVDVHERDHGGTSSRSIRELVLVESLSVVNYISSFVVNEPSPSRALNGSGLVDKHGLELLHGSPFFVNHF